jgi:hypothetical protein
MNFEQDPSAVLDYLIDWSAWLTGDTISLSAWTAPTGLTAVSDAKNTSQTIGWFSGGTLGQSYTVRNTIVTVGLRTAIKSFTITIANQ